MDYRQFWGKARPEGDGGPQWHPVAFHLLDVAAVAGELLTIRSATRARAARLLGFDEAAAARFIVALAGLHDIGKFARPFQAKCPEHWPACLGVLNPAKIPPSPHTRDGLLFWDGHLRQRLGGYGWLDNPVHWPLIRAVFGHHGKPVDETPGQLGWLFGEKGLRAAQDCATAILGLVDPFPPGRADVNDERARRASWWLAGFMTLADWIGSNSTWFPYADPSAELTPYYETARLQAREAVICAGLTAPISAKAMSFVSLTSREAPTPAQRWTESAALPDGPILVMIEDVTGAGKTEAAQMLVHRLLAAGRASGAYWAMPTQATANAMYERQEGAIARLFERDSRPSLVLTHGQARLNERFQATVVRAGRPQASFGTDDDDLTASAACAAFLADDRRASLLADVGAGTIDQAFLGVLASKFNTLRLVGLAEKVLILDEAHAYDAYMGIEAATLLRFQAALGGHAIVLSATLPKVRREELARAWREGVTSGQRPTRIAWGVPASVEPPLVACDAYPLATVVSKEALVETPIDAAPQAYRSVGVRLIHDLALAAAAIIDAQRVGSAVAWVRNTVDDCLMAADHLQSLGLEPIVFHARFAQCDRQRRERAVLDWFGPKAQRSDRAGKVLVATQVIEQSLDLDFDLLVSDLAPMDLLIQRAGRLWRHAARDFERPSGVKRELFVLSPPPVDDPDQRWLAGFRGTAAVYSNPGVLWLTTRLLAERGEIRSPDDIRDLVEGAYRLEDVPRGLESATVRAEADGNADAATANFSVLQLDRGYSGSAQAWEHDARVLTRLGEPQTILRLARVDESGILYPWHDWKDPRTAWALSEVKVSTRRVPLSVEPEGQFRKAVSLAKNQWGRFEQEIPILPLQRGATGEWAGCLVKSNGKTVDMMYTEERGLAFRSLD